MLQCVAGSVYAGTFAVPKAEHAIDLPFRIGFDLLRSKDCRSGKILIDCRQEFDPAIRQQLLRPPEFQVDPAKRRTAVTRYEARGV